MAEQDPGGSEPYRHPDCRGAHDGEGPWQSVSDRDGGGDVGRQAAEGSLSEVQDPRDAVDEHDSQRQQRVTRAAS